ncbi:hypothetical protein [Streptomyces yaizuensis]|uniref:Uncharacterized protein n=1 Tax=Streptomyces yaizuensis TaxID=2989713 RepID=A0ABQ5P692_9ACTN|nr:hypothetical protein [Streptomyces sp. YSPA8]GLF98116.1 hypothetical protein SYYSPA8_27485 [Streptomyces sp. YSPA8]
MRNPSRTWALTGLAAAFGVLLVLYALPGTALPGTDTGTGPGRGGCVCWPAVRDILLAAFTAVVPHLTGTGPP